MTKKFTAFILGILATVGGIFPSTVFDISASAEEIGTQQITTFEKTDINDDLQDIDVSTYLQNPLGDVEVLRFVEYCYSEKAFFSQYYGLYVYIYNPTQTALDIEGNTSKVNMAVEYDTTGTPTDYKNVALEYCDHTDNNRFYKFKLSNSAEYYDVAKAYAAENEGERRYDIVGIQLRQVSGGILTDEIKTANDKKHEKTYYFKGYSKGCGAESSAESTLTCRYDDLETVGLEIKHTNYRTGAYDENFVCDELNTAYFSIPNKYLDDYGGLQEISAEWYEYKTNPIFVTSDEGAYEALFSYIGREIGEKDESLPWRVMWEEQSNGVLNKVFNRYGNNKEVIGEFVFDWSDAISEIRMDWLINRNNINEDEDYKVSSEDVMSYMFWYTEKYVEQATLNGYSEGLFADSIDEDRIGNLADSSAGRGYVKQTISVDQQQNLLEKDPDQNWWDRLWQGVKYKENGYAPIIVLQKSDIEGLTVDSFAEKYLINEADKQKVYDYCLNTFQQGGKPILFRFAVTDYYASRAYFDKYAKYPGQDGYGMSAVDGYVAQQTVFLDFDIISLTFRNLNNQDTVIPTVADPIQIINGLDPAPDLNVDNTLDEMKAFLKMCKELWAWLKANWKWLVIAAVALIVGVPLIIAFLPSIIRFVVWCGKGLIKLLWWLVIGIAFVIASPVLLLIWIIKGFISLFKKE